VMALALLAHEDLGFSHLLPMPLMPSEQTHSRDHCEMERQAVGPDPLRLLPPTREQSRAAAARASRALVSTTADNTSVFAVTPCQASQWFPTADDGHGEQMQPKCDSVSET
jgi:hypothetical protein